MKVFIFAMLTLAITSSCATRYQPEGFAGGYSEIKTNADKYIVTFKGNGYTSYEKAMKYVLRRASELTLQNGFKYFIITSANDSSAMSHYTSTSSNLHASSNTYYGSNFSNTGVNGSYSSLSTSNTIVKPRLNIQIKCYRIKPIFKDYYDAEYYIKNN